jgi:outer membrane biosynthesis protein TonB
VLRPLAALSLLVGCAASLAAQDRIIRPGGASSAALHARKCTESKIEMLDVRAADSTVALPGAYTERAAKESFFYFAPPEARAPRYALVQVTVHRGGTLSGMSVVETSQDYFGREVTHVLDVAARGGAFTPFPDGVSGDSLVLRISFGLRFGETKPYLAKRKVCPAWPLASNPRPDYPPELRDHHVAGFVRTRFMVDSTGHVQPETFQVLSSTSDLLTREVRAILPRLKFQSAEVQGRKISELTEQTFSFGLDERVSP